MNEDDFVEDVQSLIKQYGLKPESINQIEWIKEMIDNLEGKINLYSALIEECKTSIMVWNSISEKIIKDHINN